MNSNERIIGSHIELEHRQPRRRQLNDYHLENDHNKDQNSSRSHSLKPKHNQSGSSQSDRSSSMNNIATNQTNISIIPPLHPIVTSTLSDVVEEK